jgi:hypothetical protein
MSTVEEYAIVHVALKTPLALGKTGSRTLLDSLLLQRLMLLYDADWGRALADMPLARRDGIWMGGGGFDQNVGRLAERRPIYRRLLSEQILDMAEAHLGITRDRYPCDLQNLMGFYSPNTSSQYMVSDALTVTFRMLGDPEAVQRLLEIEPYLGPGHSCGFGEIAHVSTAPAGTRDMGWLLTDPGKRLTRPIPDALASHIDTALAWRDQVRIEPPYWMGDFTAGWRPRPVEYAG